MAPYGIDLDRFKNSGKGKRETGKIILGAAGRLSPVKGFDLLIEALARMRNSVPWKLCLAGGGSGGESLRKQAEKLGLTDRIEFLGPVEDMKGFYESIDLLVLPSRREGLPLTLLEAMAMGLPSVASRAGDIPLVVREGMEGFLCEPGDVNDLERALSRAFEARDRLADMGLGARERVQARSLDNTADSIAAAYERILAG